MSADNVTAALADLAGLAERLDGKLQPAFKLLSAGEVAEARELEAFAENHEPAYLLRLTHVLIHAKWLKSRRGYSAEVHWTDFWDRVAAMYRKEYGVPRGAGTFKPAIRRALAIATTNDETKLIISGHYLEGANVRETLVTGTGPYEVVRMKRESNTEATIRVMTDRLNAAR